jgi:hypothetical protein
VSLLFKRSPVRGWWVVLVASLLFVSIGARLWDAGDALRYFLFGFIALVDIRDQHVIKLLVGFFFSLCEAVLVAAVAV